VDCARGCFGHAREEERALGRLLVDLLLVLGVLLAVGRGPLPALPEHLLDELADLGAEGELDLDAAEGR